MPESVVDILIIEDNLNDAELTVRALKKNNLANHIIHLSDGEKALEFLYGSGEYKDRNFEHKPRVILLDLKMPKVDGLEVLEKIKSDNQFKNIPVIILTSSTNDPDMKKAYELGANSYIVKPVDFENFSKTVAQAGLYWMIINKA